MKDSLAMNQGVRFLVRGPCEANNLLPLVVSICCKSDVSYKRTSGRYLMHHPVDLAE